MRRFRTLRVQLLLSHLVLVVLMAAVMTGAISRFFSLGRSIDRVLQGTFASVLASERLKDALQRQQQSLTLLATGQVDPASADYRSKSGLFNVAYLDLEQSAGKDTVAAVEELGSASQHYQSLVADLFRRAPKLTPDQIREIYINKIRPSMADLLERVQAIQDVNQNAIQEANIRAKEESREAAVRSLTQTGVALILAILLAFRMIRVALIPLEQVAKRVEAIGSGDLTQRIEIKRNDEIGALATSFNAMAENLAEMSSREARRLRRAELMSDTALDCLYDPVIVTDAQGRLVYLNTAAQGLFGPNPVTPRMPIVEHIGDRRIVHAIQNAIQQDRVSASEDATSLIPLKVEGANRTYRLRATPMKDTQGQLLGSVTVLEDITHLRDVDRMKTEFIGVASHELRTPVTSMLLGVQLLEEGAAGDLNAEQKLIVGSQREDLERLDRLMRELLDVSRLEAGTALPRFELVKPSDLLKAAFQTTKAPAAQRGVSLDIANGPDLQLARADRSQIGRVLVNLITNAIRHTDPGGHVQLRASEEGDQVTFCVEDDGAGIPENYREHIFERFVQVPGATGGGAGLGLSISRSIVQAHGGDMWVESELGKGSKFCFTLRTDKHPVDEETS